MPEKNTFYHFPNPEVARKLMKPLGEDDSTPRTKERERWDRTHLELNQVLKEVEDDPSINKVLLVTLKNGQTAILKLNEENGSRLLGEVETLGLIRAAKQKSPVKSPLNSGKIPEPLGAGLFTDPSGKTYYATLQTDLGPIHGAFQVMEKQNQFGQLMLVHGVSQIVRTEIFHNNPLLLLKLGNAFSGIHQIHYMHSGQKRRLLHLDPGYNIGLVATPDGSFETAVYDWDTSRLVHDLFLHTPISWTHLAPQELYNLYQKPKEVCPQTDLAILAGALWWVLTNQRPFLDENLDITRFPSTFLRPDDISSKNWNEYKKPHTEEIAKVLEEEFPERMHSDPDLVNTVSALFFQALMNEPSLRTPNLDASTSHLAVPQFMHALIKALHGEPGETTYHYPGDKKRRFRLNSLLRRKVKSK